MAHIEALLPIANGTQEKQIEKEETRKIRISDFGNIALRTKGSRSSNKYSFITFQEHVKQSNQCVLHSYHSCYHFYAAT